MSRTPPKEAIPDLDAGADNLRRALDAEASLGQGTRIGRFVIEERIGEGGSATVYAARQEEPISRKVAIKLPNWDALDSSRALDAFHAERVVLGTLDHPLIARILDAGHLDSGRPYLVMDHVEGAPLHAYCDEHRLSLEERVGLLSRVCGAVHHAHLRGVIHRDLKPQNIIVSEGDETPDPKVIDFGIARRFSEEKTGAHGRGTQGFMSPEQSEGKPADVRADIYALGCVGWKLCAGGLPARSGEMPEIVSEQVWCSKSDRASASKSLRGGLGSIFKKATAPDPEARYPSADVLARDLANWLNHEPIAAVGNSIAYRAKCFLFRHRMASLVGIVALFCVLIAGGIAIGQGLAAFRAKEDLKKALASEQHERRVAEEVTAFCTQVLTGAEADSHDHRITVSQMLKHNSEKLLQEFRGDPLIKAQLCLTLSRACASRNLLADAYPLAEKAVHLRSRNLGPRDSATIEAMHVAGTLLTNLGRHAEARAMLDVALRRTEDGITKLRLAVPLASALSQMRNPKAAEELLEPLMAHGGAEESLRVEASLALASARYKAGEQEVAIVGLTELQKRSAEKEAGGSEDVRASLALANLLYISGQNAQAVEILRSVADCETAPRSARDGALLRLRVVGEKDSPQFEEIVDSLSGTAGESHPLTFAARIELALDCANNGKLKRSSEILLATAQDAEMALGGAHPLTCRALLEGLKLDYPENSDERDQYVRNTISGFFGRHSEEIRSMSPHPDHIRLRILLAAALERSDSLSGARAVLQMVLSEVRQLSSKGRVFTASTLLAFAGVELKHPSLANVVAAERVASRARPTKPSRTPIIPGVDIVF